MSPAQQRGLALWPAAECAGVPAVFAGSPLGAWLILLVTLALIIGVWRIASRRAERNVASTLDPLPDGAYRQPVVLVCGDLPFVWSQSLRCGSSNRAAGSAWKRRRSCSRSRARY
jgi:hypothetical protein